MATGIKKRIFDILALLLVATGIYIAIREVYIKPRQLARGETAYSVATITEFFSPSDGVRQVKFSYKVNTNYYGGFFNAYEHDVQVGNRFFIEFLKTDPANSKIMFNHPVPDSIQTVPAAGWDRLPY